MCQDRNIQGNMVTPFHIQRQDKHQSFPLGPVAVKTGDPLLNEELMSSAYVAVHSKFCQNH